MVEQIREALMEASSLDDVRDRLAALFQEIKQKDPKIKIIYVAGMITSEGPENISRNIEILRGYTEEVRKIMGPYVFSATDVFSQELFDRIDANGAKSQDYMKMWRGLFKTKLVDTIVVTPRWQRSVGTCDEHLTFRQLGLERYEIDRTLSINPLI